MQCFFCGETKGIALLGKLKGDEKAPDAILMDYEPCDECKKKFSQGVLLVGVSKTAPDNRPPISEADGEKVYPTGSYVVATEDFITRMMEPDIAAEAIKAGKCAIYNDILSEWQKQHEEACKEDREDG